MFIFTAKLSRRRAVIALVILAAVLCTVVLLAGKRSEPRPGLAASPAKTNEQRVRLLTDLGWQVSPKPVEEQTVVIPREFTDIYEEYNDLQISQGFDLKKYGGLEATRYTYEVENYPDCADRVYADMIVYKGKLIAGDVQSSALDGFMRGLEYPQ
jgi:hypothetical protein